MVSKLSFNYVYTFRIHRSSRTYTYNQKFYQYSYGFQNLMSTSKFWCHESWSKNFKITVGRWLFTFLLFSDWGFDESWQQPQETIVGACGHYVSTEGPGTFIGEFLSSIRNVQIRWVRWVYHWLWWGRWRGC